MNMRKRKRTQWRPRLALRVLHIGLILIYASLLRLLFEVQSAAPLTPRAAAYFGGLLEYPLAALVLLTGAVLLLGRAEREEG